MERTGIQEGTAGTSTMRKNAENCKKVPLSNPLRKHHFETPKMVDMSLRGIFWRNPVIFY
jgi:hypothetical protein